MKKFILFTGLVFCLFLNNFIFAEETPVCVLPQVLDGSGLNCIDPLSNPTTEEPEFPKIICKENEELIENICKIKETENTVEKLTIDELVDVPKSCSVLDLDGVEHLYTSPSDESYLGICALEALLNSQNLSSVGFSNEYPSMGLFVTSFNDKEADPYSEYWGLYINEGFAEEGISTLPIVAGDVISFKLSDFSGVETGDYVSVTISSLIKEVVAPPVVCGSDEELDQNTNTCIKIDNKEDISNPSSGGGSSSSNTVDNFSLEKAISFLLGNKENDGSFSDDMYTDWVVVGVSKIDLGDDSIIENLKNFILSNDIEGGTVTDYARRAMALLSLGVNPYDDTNINYIEKILLEFDGEQIGDKNIFNDDIFSLMVLSKVGHEESDETIKKIISFVLLNQEDDGSFGSVDMTSAFIMALEEFKNVDGVSEAIKNAENYILSEQKEDGSFGNIYSTSWAVQALSLNNSFSNEIGKGIEFLKNSQKEDGSFVNGDNLNKIWATSYALPAIYKLSWNSILEDFDRQEVGNERDETEESIKEDKEESENIKSEELKNTEKEKPLLFSENNVSLVAVNKKQEIPQNKIEELVEIKNLDNENIINRSDLLGSVGDIPNINEERFFVRLNRFFSILWGFILNIFI